MESKQDEEGNWTHTRVLTVEEAQDILRMIRVSLLKESDLWMSLDRYNVLSSEQQTELLEWRQMLRDLPASEDPYNPTWTDKPAWMN